MPAPVVKVEIGADLGDRDPFGFTLNSSLKGRLNNAVYTLGGAKFYDITDRLLSASTQRGKSTALDRIDAGNATINLNNSDRLFDPLFESGQYFGNLVPGIEVNVSCNNRAVIYSFIDDIDIAYAPKNNSVTSIQSVDALSQLTINNLPDVSVPIELSGARVNRILDLPEIAWPTDKRLIDSGNSQLADGDIVEGTQAISYLQLIATSEAGEIFISKDNKFVFKERNAAPGTLDLVFTDEATIPGYTVIPFADIGVEYGTEQLYNRIVITNDQVIPDQAIAEDAESQRIYGPRSYTQDGLLNEEVSELEVLAGFLLARFKDPQYRFSSLSVILDILSEAQQNAVLDLEIGDVVQVKFTPSGISPAIQQYVRIICISHDWSSNEKRINLSLDRLDFSLFVLDDQVLGVLDDDRLSY